MTTIVRTLIADSQNSNSPYTREGKQFTAVASTSCQRARPLSVSSAAELGTRALTNIVDQIMGLRGGRERIRVWRSDQRDGDQMGGDEPT